MSAEVVDLMNAYGLRRARLTSLLVFNDHDGENNFVNTTMALAKMPSAPLFDEAQIAAALPDLAAQSVAVVQAMNTMTVLVEEYGQDPWLNTGHRWERPDEPAERDLTKTAETVSALETFQAADPAWIEVSKRLGLLES